METRSEADRTGDRYKELTRARTTPAPLKRTILALERHLVLHRMHNLLLALELQLETTRLDCFLSRM